MSLKTTLQLNDAPWLRENMCGASPSSTELIMYDVRTKGADQLALRVSNASAYFPTSPTLDPQCTSGDKCEDWKELKYKGYLFNGRKSPSTTTKDLLELNLCQRRYLKAKFCLEKRGGLGQPESVQMERLTLRVFDIDHRTV